MLSQQQVNWRLHNHLFFDNLIVFNLFLHALCTGKQQQGPQSMSEDVTQGYGTDTQLDRPQSLCYLFLSKLGQYYYGNFSSKFYVLFSFIFLQHCDRERW